MDSRFLNQTFQIRKKVLSFAGAKFHIFDHNGNVIMFSKMKAFKLREDIRIYTGEDMSDELIRISARQVIDFSATYDVYDSKTCEKLGALKRSGLKSIFKDEWLIFNQNDMEIGAIKEDSTILALLRRFLPSLLPQSYDISINGTNLAVFEQNFNPFVTKLNLDFSRDMYGTLD